MSEHQESAPRSASPIRDMQSFVGGLVLLGFVVLGWIAGANLPWGALNSIGPGLLPRVVLILIAGVGVTLIVHAFLGDGPRVLLRDFSGILALAALTLVAVILGAVLGLAGLGEVLGLPPFALVFCIIYALTLIALARLQRQPSRLARPHRVARAAVPDWRADRVCADRAQRRTSDRRAAAGADLGRGVGRDALPRTHHLRHRDDGAVHRRVQIRAQPADARVDHSRLHLHLSGSV